MARVTVEDCIDKVDNRFDLVLLAAHRARMISSGSQLTIDRDNDKNPVVSLREIADSTISPEGLTGVSGSFGTSNCGCWPGRAGGGAAGGGAAGCAGSAPCGTFSNGF